MKINCITFDKQAQDSLPEDIKRQMKADRDKAREDKNKDIKIMSKGVELIAAERKRQIEVEEGES